MLSRISITLAGPGIMPQVREALDHIESAHKGGDNEHMVILFAQVDGSPPRTVWWVCTTGAGVDTLNPNEVHARGGDL